MNKKLSKAIMEKSRIQNRRLKYLSRENIQHTILAYKNIKNKCNDLLKQAKKKYVKDSIKQQELVSHSGIQSNPF